MTWVLLSVSLGDCCKAISDLSVSAHGVPDVIRHHQVANIIMIDHVSRYNTDLTVTVMYHSSNVLWC